MNVTTIEEKPYFYSVHPTSKKHIIYENGEPLCGRHLSDLWEDMDGLDTEKDDVAHVCKSCLKIIRKPNVVETPDGWEMK